MGIADEGLDDRGRGMRRLLVLALLLLAVGTVYASVSGFMAHVSNQGEVTAVDPGEGTLDCVPADDIEIQQDTTSLELPSFVCHNDSAVNVTFQLASADSIVQMIAPAGPTLPPSQDQQFDVVYDGSGLSLGTRSVSFDVEADGDGISASFSFEVEIEVVL